MLPFQSSFWTDPRPRVPSRLDAAEQALKVERFSPALGTKGQGQRSPRTSLALPYCQTPTLLASAVPGTGGKPSCSPPAAAAAPGCREMAVCGSCEQAPGCPGLARFWHPSALLPYLCQRCSLLWPQPSGPCKVIISVPAEQQLCDAIWKGRWRCQAPCSESWDVQERRQCVTCTAWAGS